MKQQQTIALCIPAYNAAVYLPKLLDSAKNQAIPFNEILVYDDCSTDNTKQIAEAYGATVIKGDINRGCSYGKNKLAEHANSQWLHFHDADDLLLPNFTSVVNKWMASSDSPDVVLLNFEYRDASTNALICTPSYDLAMMQNDPVKFTITHKIVNFGIYKRASFLKAGGFNLNKKVLYNEDAAFHHRLSLAKLTFGFEEEVTCINYRYTQSMSASNFRKCLIAKYHVTGNLLAHDLQKKYSNEIGTIYWELAGLFASLKDWEYTKKSVAKAMAITKSRVPKNEKNTVLKYLCGLDPFIAHTIREYYIRLFKPRLRQA
jgi:glycosyltransferase involved in cell wall biosynthesis